MFKSKRDEKRKRRHRILPEKIESSPAELGHEHKLHHSHHKNEEEEQNTEPEDLDEAETVIMVQISYQITLLTTFIRQRQSIEALVR